MKKIIISLALLACSILPAYSHCNLCFYKENPAGLSAEALALLPSYCQGYANGASLADTLAIIPSEKIDAFRYYTLKSGHVELYCDCHITSNSNIGNTGKRNHYHIEAQNSISSYGVGFCAKSVEFECASAVDEMPPMDHNMPM